MRGGGRDGLQLFQDWEAVSGDVWGPRAGKSSSRAIPAIIAAPGAVVATSNKRDLVDATRDPRSAIAAAARTLAAVFANAVRKPRARTDAYFDGAALALLACLLLAAAAARGPPSARAQLDR